MHTRYVAPAAAVICIVALCVILVGIALNNAWVSGIAVCVALLTGIYGMAFALRGR